MLEGVDAHARGAVDLAAVVSNSLVQQDGTRSKGSPEELQQCAADTGSTTMGITSSTVMQVGSERQRNAGVASTPSSNTEDSVGAIANHSVGVGVAEERLLLGEPYMLQEHQLMAIVRNLAASAKSPGIGLVLFTVVAVVACLVGVAVYANSRQLPAFQRTPETSASKKAVPEMAQAGAYGRSKPLTSTTLNRSGPSVAHSGMPSAASAERAEGPESSHLSICPQLCPSLVVPYGSECVLAVRPALAARKGSVSIDVLDMTGKPVLKCSVRRPVDWSSGPDPTRRLPNIASRPPVMTLRMLEPTIAKDTSRDTSILVQCHASVSAEGRRQMLVYDMHGLLFGRLIREETSRPRYVLSTAGGDSKIIFDGIFSDHVVLVTDQNQDEVAEVEPCGMAFDPTGTFYRLRIACGVDVGVVLTGLICIDEMELPAVTPG